MVSLVIAVQWIDQNGKTLPACSLYDSLSIYIPMIVRLFCLFSKERKKKVDLSRLLIYIVAFCRKKLRSRQSCQFYYVSSPGNRLHAISRTDSSVKLSKSQTAAQSAKAALAVTADLKIRLQRQHLTDTISDDTYASGKNVSPQLQSMCQLSCQVEKYEYQNIY